MYDSDVTLSLNVAHSVCDSFCPYSPLMIKINNERVGYTPTLHTCPTPLIWKQL